MKRKEIEEVDDDTLWPTKRARIEPTFMIISLLPDEMIQEVALRTNRVMDMEAMACVCRDWARALTPSLNEHFWKICWKTLVHPGFKPSTRRREKRIGSMSSWCFFEEFYTAKEEERMKAKLKMHFQLYPSKVLQRIYDFEYSYRCVANHYFFIQKIL